VEKTKQCPDSKPWGVINSTTGVVVRGGCHETKAEAVKHMQALYANVPDVGKEQQMGDCGCGRTWHDLEDHEGIPVAGGHLILNDDGDYTYRASVDSSTWDGNAAMSNCSKSDSPASCFGAICAGRKEGPADERQSWALPHHKEPGAAPNASGVSNALSRLPQTQGLTNEAAAKSHLEKHMKAINPDYEPSKDAGAAERRALLEQAATARREGLGERNGWRAGARHQTREAPASNARQLVFPAEYQLRAELVEREDGMKYNHLEGYASVVGIPYQMWDMFGPYDEIVADEAFDVTLSADPDVSFLANHRGLTMARTTNKTLELAMDARGLHSDVYVNPKRTDVKDLVMAIEARLITEMSFAFMLVDGEWDKDFTTFTIREVDLERGDVSAVNYGANPYTSVGARQQEILRELRELPRGAQVEALRRLQACVHTYQQRIDDHEQQDRVERLEQAQTAAVNGTGLSTQLVLARLQVDADYSYSLR
jgi:HK97 family phage prohead protease